MASEFHISFHSFERQVDYQNCYPILDFVQTRRRKYGPHGWRQIFLCQKGFQVQTGKQHVDVLCWNRRFLETIVTTNEAIITLKNFFLERAVFKKFDWCYQFFSSLALGSLWVLGSLQTRVTSLRAHGLCMQVMLVLGCSRHDMCVVFLLFWRYIEPPIEKAELYNQSSLDSSSLLEDSCPGWLVTWMNSAFYQWETNFWNVKGLKLEDWLLL